MNSFTIGSSVGDSTLSSSSSNTSRKKLAKRPKKIKPAKVIDSNFYE